MPITWNSIRFFALFTALLFALCFEVHATQVQNIDWRKAAKASDISLSEAQKKQLKDKKLTAALVWHGASPWITAVTRGAQDAFAQLGVEVVAVTDAQFDPAKQVADLENISALNPDIILSLSVDGISTKQSYQKAISQGAKLVLLSNPIPEFQHGKDFFGIVTDDMFGMGEAAAELVNRSVKGQGKVGIIYHDANYFITNNRDNAFKIKLQEFENLTVVSQRGFIKESETSNIAAAMILQNPELDAIYVSWDAAAEGVVEALRSFGNKKVKVITHDLGVNNLLDMAMSRNMFGTISDRPHTIGSSMAYIAGLAVLGEPTPLFTLVPYDTVTKENISTIWQHAFKVPVPKLLDLALQQ